MIGSRIDYNPVGRRKRLGVLQDGAGGGDRPRDSKLSGADPPDVKGHRRRERNSYFVEIFEPPGIYRVPGGYLDMRPAVFTERTR